MGYNKKQLITANIIIIWKAKTIGFYADNKEWWGEEMKESKKLMRLTFLIYILGVMIITFVIRENMDLRTPENRGVVLQPFREVEAMIEQPRHFFWFMQIFLNILLFVPFGALLPGICERCRKMAITVGIGFIFSCLIEAMQYVTGRGLTEADDVINNTLGAFAGYGIYIICSRIIERRKSDTKA